MNEIADWLRTLPPLVSIDDLATPTCLDPGSIRRWSKNGILPRTRRLGRRVFFDRAELIECFRQLAAT